MGWFDEQIKQRKLNDDNIFANALSEIKGAVLGVKISASFSSNKEKTKDALKSILNFYKLKPIEPSYEIEDFNEQIDYFMNSYGIMRQNICLKKGWYKDAINPILGIKKSDRSAVAFLPSTLFGYVYFDSELGKYIKVNKKNENLFEDEAITFYKPFLIDDVSVKGLVISMMQRLSFIDYIYICFTTVAITILGFLTPKLNHLLISNIIHSGQIRCLVGIMVFMVSVTLSTALIKAFKGILFLIIGSKQSFRVLLMAKVMGLPASFFKKYSSGELSNILQKANSFCDIISTSIFPGFLTFLFSGVYFLQIFKYSSVLVVPSVLILLTTCLFSIAVTLVQINGLKKVMRYDAKENGIIYAMISGIQKIKLSGSEKRAFARWSKIYTKKAKLVYNPPFIVKYNSAISKFISHVGFIYIYFVASSNDISVANYYAFVSAYGMLSVAFMSLVSLASSIANIKSIFDIIKPLLDEKTEILNGKRVIGRLSGKIELNNVSFGYSETMPKVIDSMSLKILPGQYVAIVGATGCGKSTLVRLLLGFETPNKGAIYYDGQDLSKIDLKSLRRRIGSVIQNGSLFSGDVFSNITISAPHLTLKDAWEAAEIAGIAEDIRNMPMGMHTLLSEGSGGISGGQRQRIMIARAIASKPKILIFDEATSALDNLTQAKISDALKELKCTRIIIAHRLSTIKHCDRILFLENGNIAEDGTYEELIAKDGKFAELVDRQRIVD